MISQIVRYRISNKFASKHSLTLSEQDPEIFNLIKQCEKINIIDFAQTPTSLAVKECLSSMMSAKYASGFPGKKNKPGTEIYEQIEKICWQRAIDGLQLDKQNFQVNVQLQSAQAAKFVVSKAMVKPGGTILCLGNLDTQCLQKYYKVIKEDNKQEKIDLVIDSNLDNLESLYKQYQSTSTPILLDITEKAPFYVSNILENEQKYLDHYQFIVLRTESLLGPKGCILFTNRKYQELVEEACYPGYQSGPHFHTLTALAVSLQELKTEELKNFFYQVKANCSSLKRQLTLKQFPLIETQGTYVSISATNQESQLLTDAGIIAPFKENKIDFNMTPLTYQGMKQDAIPTLSNVLGLALYKSLHGNFMSDPNNIGWKHELELAKKEFFQFI